MRLFKRKGSPYWQVLFPGRLRISTRCKTKRAAEAWAKQRELELANPALAAQETATLRDALGAWIEDREAAGRSAATLDYYAARCGPLLRIFGEDYVLADVDERSVQAYIATREQEVSRGTVAKELKLLRATLKLARQRGHFSRDPETVIPRGYSAPYKPRKRFLTWCQAGELLAALAPPRCAHAAFMLATGARIGASCRARPEDVDFDKGVVHIRGTKTAKSARLVPILPHVRWMLEFAKPHMPFTFWDRSNANRDLASACRRASVPRVSANDLRRTAAQWLRELGCDVALIAEFLGHTSTKMVFMVYGRLEGRRLGEAIVRAAGSFDQDST